jgi:hypothetical protein
MAEEQVVLKQVPSEYVAVVQQKSMKSVRSSPTQSYSSWSQRNCYLQQDIRTMVHR